MAKSRSEKSKKEKIIENLLSGKAEEIYKGKQVAIIDEKVFILPEEGKKSAQLVNRLIKKYPQKRPTLLFVPRDGSYILVFAK